MSSPPEIPQDAHISSASSIAALLIIIDNMYARQSCIGGYAPIKGRREQQCPTSYSKHNNYGSPYCGEVENELEKLPAKTAPSMKLVKSGFRKQAWRAIVDSLPDDAPVKGMQCYNSM